MVRFIYCKKWKVREVLRTNCHKYNNCIKSPKILWNEYLITKHTQFSTPLNIINLYGSQECRVSKERISIHWEEICSEVTRIEAKGEYLLMIGDINRLVGDAVDGNDPKISFGGNLIRDFIADRRYILVNNCEFVTGGPWTRIDRKDQIQNLYWI